MLHIVMENNPSTLNLHILFKGVKNAFPASARSIQVSKGTWVKVGGGSAVREQWLGEGESAPYSSFQGSSKLVVRRK